MSRPTIIELCNSIETTLATATNLTYTKSIGDLTESMSDTPVLLVYGAGGIQDPTSVRADRSSFGAGIRQSNITVRALLLVSPRHEIAEEQTKLAQLIDAIIDVLEDQDTKPYFGNAQIAAFTYSWELVGGFKYGGEEFPGAAIDINLRVYS